MSVNNEETGSDIMVVYHVTVKLNLELSFRNKLEKCCLYILVCIPCNTDTHWCQQ